MRSKIRSLFQSRKICEVNQVNFRPRDWRSGFISRGDVAEFLVKQIGDASLVHQTPVLTG